MQEFKVCTKKNILFFAFFILFSLCFQNKLKAEDFYWESPASVENQESRFPVVINTSSFSYLIWQEVDTSKKEIYLSLRKYTSLTAFEDNLRFSGPYKYSGDEVPDIFTACANQKGSLAISVLNGIDGIEVLLSLDEGKTFSKAYLKSKDNVIAPRIYVTSGNTYKLFVSSGTENSFTILTADSKDGKDWTSFSVFAPSSKMQTSFIPVLIADEVNKTDFVVFQSQLMDVSSNRYSYQLYLTVSTDLKKWTEPLLITDQSSFGFSSSLDFTKVQNQMPSLFSDGKNIYLTWERTVSNQTQIWFSQINKDGIVKETCEAVTESGNASKGVLFNYKDELYITWFDTRRGRESVYMAKKNGNLWTETTLVENNYANSFVNPLIVKGENGEEVLSFVWQQNRNNKNTISILSPDKTVEKPEIIPSSFKKGKKSSAKNVSFRLKFPSDSSNIAGYSYTWSKDSASEPEKQIAHFTNESVIKTEADEGDGNYFLNVKIVDYAGNWSKTQSCNYKLDTTPPLPPEIVLSNTDDFGFMDSSVFRLEWKKQTSIEEDDTDHFLYRFDYAGSIPSSLVSSKYHKITLSKEEVETEKEKLKAKYKNAFERKREIKNGYSTQNTFTRKIYNEENGVYILSVASVDDCGNISESGRFWVFVNKYVPSTSVSYVKEKNTKSGDYVFDISGSGFTYDGKIQEIYLDKDGKAPYDYTLKLSDKAFSVTSDKVISNADFGNQIDEGKYRIGLLHPKRGIYFSDKVISISQSGTLKIESQYVKPEKYTRNFVIPEFQLYISQIVSVLILIFLVFTILILIYTFTTDIIQKIFVQKEIHAIYLGERLPMERNKTKKHQPSLRSKLMFFAYSLVVICVTIVTVQNGINSLNTQSQTLANGLEERADVLLESLCSGVKNFFPSDNLLELSALPSQKDAMSEVEYVSIIGQKSSSATDNDLSYVWATNDSSITDKIDNYSLIYGESKITDEELTGIIQKFSSFDSIAGVELNSLSSQIEQLTSQATALYASASSDAQTQADEISTEVMNMRNELDSKLLSYSKAYASSYPKFDTSNLDMHLTDYYFYRPVLYRKGNTGNYIHGIVILKLSTKSLVESISKQRASIIRSGIILALIAAVLGGIGAAFFASLIVRPIKKLESHVILIGSTKNKKNLKGKDVVIKSKDEIGRLGTAINDMAHELIQVAEEEELTMDGKAVQNAFLPLLSDELHNKKTIAELNDKNVQCFGYYEGESGVSGDYFDYRKLEDPWFVIIKCDASGHGIPAAIIMTVVATLFRRYFANWKFKEKGIGINNLVVQINDFIEALGLKGKFATLIICLLNQKTGEIYMCNAGDRLVHVFDSSTKKVSVITLKSAPTAGIFSSDLVNMSGGFAVEKYMLKKGDILFLYTDGIEESTRRIRNKDYVVLQQENNGKMEDQKEEFGPERVSEIIEAVLNKKAYELTKIDNPNSEEKLIFDFTKCEGSISEAIIALASIEKVFRLYKSPETQSTDYIRIDKKIDDFLKKYFNLYDYYAAGRSENPEIKNYVDYDSMNEDEQSDDLTLLAVKRC